MTKTTSSLDTFDFLELLYMLSQQGRSGKLSVHRPDGLFQAWLLDGQVMHLQFGEERGASALTALLLDPRGRFQFEEGVRHPNPRVAASLDEIALEALEALELDPLPFEGPARITDRERLYQMRWSMRELDILHQIDAQRPVSDLNSDPEARRILQKLYRVGLLKQRKSRTARLVITVTREVQGVALVDEHIFKRWKDDIIRTPQQIGVKTDQEQVYLLPVRGRADVGNQLLIPPDLLVRTGLRAGESVLVRPV